MLKILCKKNKAVVDQAAKTQKIYKADRVYFDAYYNTELWTIANGLPSQSHPPLRTTNLKGNVIPDKAAIKKLVDRAYPTPPPAPPGWRRVDYKKTPPQTKWYHTGTRTVLWKPSVKGETFAGPQQTVNKKHVPAKSLKCP